MPGLPVTLLTEIIAPHRIEPLNLLGSRSDVDLRVLFFAETDDSRKWSVPRESIRFPYRVLRGMRLPSIYQNFSLFFNPGVVLALIRSRPRVVVFGGWHQPTMWIAMIAARLLGTRRLIWSESTLRDHRSSGRLKSLVKNWFIGGAHGFIVPGSAQEDYVRAVAPPGAKVWRVPNAVDNRRFHKSEQGAEAVAALRERLGRGRPVILYVGRIVEEKGIPELLEAARRLGDRASFVLVGDGPGLAEFRKEASAPGAGNVDFAGHVEQTALPLYYAAADIFAFPTRSDPWGLVLNEAMAAGLPIVCSDAAGAAPDLVRDGENGRLFRAGDTDGLISALSELLADPDARRRMGEESRGIIDRFTPEAMTRAFEVAFAEVAGLNRAPDMLATPAKATLPDPVDVQPGAGRPPQ